MGPPLKKKFCKIYMFCYFMFSNTQIDPPSPGTAGGTGEMPACSAEGSSREEALGWACRAGAGRGQQLGASCFVLSSQPGILAAQSRGW